MKKKYEEITRSPYKKVLANVRLTEYENNRARSLAKAFKMSFSAYFTIALHEMNEKFEQKRIVGGL